LPCEGEVEVVVVAPVTGRRDATTGCRAAGAGVETTGVAAGAGEATGADGSATGVAGDGDGVATGAGADVGRGLIE
jgi:hypothetical protein